MDRKTTKQVLSITKAIVLAICFAFILVSTMENNRMIAYATATVGDEGAFVIEARQVDSGITVYWTAEEGASYQIECSMENDNAYSTLKTIENVSGKQEYTDTNVEVGVTYYYKVKRLINKEVDKESNSVSIKYVLLPPQNINNANKKGNPKIKWDKVNGAKKYRIYRRANAGNYNKSSGFKKLAETKKLSYTDKTVKAGNLYEYYVVAMDDEANTSEPSEKIYKYYNAESFEIQSAFTKTKKIKLSWEKVPAAKKYIIYKKNSSGKYKKLAETTKAYYSDGKVKKGKTYKYKVAYVYNLPDGKTHEKKSSVYTIYASNIDPNKKMVAITFDDGPGRYTQEIVDCLKKNDARATFYVLGCNVDNYKSAVKNAHKIGCEIGNHSYDHTILTTISADAVAKQMSDTDAKIKNVIGSKAKTMRAPGGGVSKTVQGAVGKPIILWSIDTLDWKTRNTEKTVSAVMNNVKDGDIVLMHDIHEPTKRAALRIIPALKKKGYQLVTVSELAKYRGYTLSNGTIYHSLRKKSK